MLGDDEWDALADALELAFETLVGERDQPAAVIANEVMVVAGAVTDRLEADDPLFHLDPRDELRAFELFEDAVDARARDAARCSRASASCSSTAESARSAARRAGR